MNTIIVTHVEAQRNDGTTSAVITNVISHPDDVEEPLAAFGLPAHEDEEAWRLMAAQAALDAGWMITGPWQHRGSLAFAPVIPA